MWDEMLSEPAPNSQLLGCDHHYLQARAAGFGAQGPPGRSRAELAKSEKLIAAVPAEATQGNNDGEAALRDRPAESAGAGRKCGRKRDEAVALLTQAVAIEDKLAYNEPNDMIFPTRHALGAELLAAGKPAEAEAVFKEDLKCHPEQRLGLLWPEPGARGAKEGRGGSGSRASSSSKPGEGRT